MDSMNETALELPRHTTFVSTAWSCSARPSRPVRPPGHHAAPSSRSRPAGVKDGEVLALPAAALPVLGLLRGTPAHKIIPRGSKGLGLSTLGQLLWDFWGARGGDSTACPRHTA